MSKNKRDAVIIILICNAILISLLELIIPVPVPLPGVKLGLGNIITIIAIVFLDLKDVLIIVFLRCIVVAVLSKGITMLAFSLSGGIMSALIMWLLYKKLHNILSIKGISIAGAIVHNSAQLLVASLILREMIILYYLPILLVSSVVTGLITGSISDLTVREISKRRIFSDSI
ncbi:MAG: Gx transporter family protein [Desulfitobacteriaceae bacterium]